MCDDKYDTIAENVVNCADKQVSEFIDWCKTQPFYENTVIVIVGDHPRMDKCMVDGINDKDRTMYNCFINPSVKDEGEINVHNRVFTAMDMFPTTLSAMGFEYDGYRIGIGTDMFSGKPTLAEEMGFDNFASELRKHSDYYINKFS